MINFKSPEPVFRETGIFLRVPVFIDTCSGLFEITTHDNACMCFLASYRDSALSSEPTSGPGATGFAQARRPLLDALSGRSFGSDKA